MPTAAIVTAGFTHRSHRTDDLAQHQSSFTASRPALSVSAAAATALRRAIRAGFLGLFEERRMKPTEKAKPPATVRTPAHVDAAALRTNRARRRRITRWSAAQLYRRAVRRSSRRGPPS